MKRLLYGCDEIVMDWTCQNYGQKKLHYDAAVGIVEDGALIGSIIWQAWRGYDIEISYYGPKTMTLGIARECARVAIDTFGVSRVTARTAKSNKLMTRKVKKIGFEYEGICHNGYGDQDAVVYGLYGKNLARLAGRTLQ